MSEDLLQVYNSTYVHVCMLCVHMPIYLCLQACVLVFVEMCVACLQARAYVRVSLCIFHM